MILKALLGFCAATCRLFGRGDVAARPTLQFLVPSLLALVLALPAHAAEQFTVADIRVQGLQRVSAGTVFNLLNVNVGDTIDEIDGRSIIRSLFQAGYFSDISIGRDGNILIITVVERPAIDSIELEGNKSIESEALLAGLRDGGLAEGEIFRRSTLERVDLELERAFRAADPGPVARRGVNRRPGVTEEHGQLREARHVRHAIGGPAAARAAQFRRIEIPVVKPGAALGARIVKAARL